jgi:hypothetical protein
MTTAVLTDRLTTRLPGDGNKPQAIANYQKAIQLNPDNQNAIQMLRRLNAP